MTPEQIQDALTKYEEYLSAYGVPLRHPAGEGAPTNEAAGRHALWMCSEVRKFLADGRREKADRWLGFIQGVLWVLGNYTIDNMRAHNTAPAD